MIIAIDPGTTESAFVFWNGQRIIKKDFVSNFQLLTDLRGGFGRPTQFDEVHIEMIASYGMPVGKETFETVLWIGRFIEAWPGPAPQLVYRAEVKMHLCQSVRAKDANIRQALIDRFGPPGTKKQQGVLYGVKSHLWSALAIAVTAYDRLDSQIMEFHELSQMAKDGVIK